MVKVYCHVCSKVANLAYNNSDFICNCSEGNSNQATAKEDVFKLGAFDDFSGSGGHTNFYLGQTNELDNTKAKVIDPTASAFARTKRGNIAELYRQRDRLTYIEVKHGRQTR